jgi:hypothetical protein
MVWCILLIISLIIFGVGLHSDKQNIMCIGVVLVVVIGCVVGAISGTGVSDYECLIKKRETAMSYATKLKEIQRMSSTLKERDSGVSSVLIDDSVSYIETYVKAIAEYNSHLELCIRAKRSVVRFWLGEGLFMSKAILTLKPIEYK